jgi:miniconductance mechanosensitive channel
MDLFIRQTTTWLIDIFSDTGMSETGARWMGELIMFLALLLVSYLAYVITWRVMRSVLMPLMKRSKNQFDDLLIKHNFFKKVSYLVPAVIIYYFTDDTISFSPLISFIKTITEIFFVLNAILIFNSILSTINDFYERYEFSKDHPLKGVFQVLKIIIYILGILFVVGMLIDRDISSLILSLGAVSAILLLIFKDPILGLVGGLQLIFNKMLSIGDWISMPKFGADGTVLEINLTTVKVQNWDKTIVTIPTYNLISDSFQNWRGMEESGGRRIKRSINIDMDSIRFCDEEMLIKFNKISILKSYLDRKKEELVKYNKEFKTDPTSLVNGRRQTNIGVFRAYLEQYLKNRTDIHQDMTFLVRQLQPTEKGLPIEIYIFTKTIAWANYESVQSDIFDHIIAAIPEFGLKVYQFPKSGDLALLTGKNN